MQTVSLGNIFLTIHVLKFERPFIVPGNGFTSADRMENSANLGQTDP